MNLYTFPTLEQNQKCKAKNNHQDHIACEIPKSCKIVTCSNT